MISGIEKFYCKSRLHAHIWRWGANRVFPDFIPYFPPSPSVLEIGTGQGLGAIFLAEKLNDATIMGIDIEHDMVETARQNVTRKNLQKRIRMEWGDALHLQYPDDTFDAVVSITVLHHVPGYVQAILEAARVLKPNGLFLVIDFDFTSSMFPRFEVFFGHPASVFSWDEMSAVLQKAGFKILTVKFYSLGLFISASVKRG